MKTIITSVAMVILASLSLHAQNVGVGTDSPVEFFSVGASSQFRVNASGNLVRINNVQYSFPAVQATSGSVLANDGSGNLSWTKVTTGNISATGTANNTTFLRGDGSWQTPAGGGVTFTTFGTITLLNPIQTTFSDIFQTQTLAAGTYLISVYVETDLPALEGLVLELTDNSNVVIRRNGYTPPNDGDGVTTFTTQLIVESPMIIKVRARAYVNTKQITGGNVTISKLY